MAYLLGMEDEPLGKDEEGHIDFKVNKVGGKPNWASGDHPNPMCKLCHKQMLLAVQIYAPLNESLNHRTLYQFCCLQPQCQSKNEGWVCIRDETVDTSVTSSCDKLQPTATASTTTWIDDADDWGDEEDMEADSGTPNEHGRSEPQATLSVQSGISTLTIQDLDTKPSELALPKSLDTCDHITIPSAEVEGDESVVPDDLPSQPTVDIRALFAPSSAPISDPSGLQFSSFYLNVSEEHQAAVLSDEKLDQRAKELWEEYQRRENCDWKNLQKSNKITPGRIDEAYEKVPPSHGDRVVHKFITQVQSCPEQLIRYNRGASKPLLLKQLTKDEPISKCRHCNALLVFEMQLMPHLSQLLKLKDTAGDYQPVEIGTVLVFTCSKSCWSGVPCEEYLIVQSEIY
ncbi:programmed cell death protein 2-like [Daphnia carinata]|uniref:programmed cell death protein 2-like n=1 Tax=Daphnia carinata TaxID=120202 RepID=UPI0025796DE8|nr:programmed cell death protein 2-like [Daphnia carinata]